MPIEVNSVVQKQDIANSLVSETGEFQNYSKTKPDCTVLNINDLFKDAAYLEKNFDPNLFCKTPIFPQSETLFNINRTESDIMNGEVAKFDTLSAMFVQAAIPLTNIRRSSFSFMEKNGNTYTKKTYFRDVSLADNAIIGNNDSFLFANNINDGGDNRICSNFLVDTTDLFLQYSGIQEVLEEYKENLVLNDYEPRVSAVPTISTGTLYDLSNLFINGVDKIRNDLSCAFVEDGAGLSATLTYYKENDGSGGTISKTYNRGEVTTISNYTALFPTHTGIFAGWNTKSSQKTVTYSPGASITMIRNLSVYPVFTDMKTVTYHNDTATNIVVEVPGKNVYIGEEGSTYQIKGIGLYNTSTNPLAFKDKNSETFFKSRFLGYAATKTGGKAYNAGSSITLNKNYDIYPLFSGYSALMLMQLSSGWSVTSQNKTVTTHLKKYPLTIDMSNFTDRNGKRYNLNASWFTHVKVTFTGWVNEMNQTHPCSIYGYINQGSSCIWSTHKLFSYSAGNKWSWRYRPTIPWQQWPTYNTGEIALNKNSTSNKLNFYWYVVDEFKDKKSGSEGAVAILQIEFLIKN